MTIELDKGVRKTKEPPVQASTSAQDAYFLNLALVTPDHIEGETPQEYKRRAQLMAAVFTELGFYDFDEGSAE